MAAFKCKMCGGSLDAAEGESIITCEFCDTKQTLPKLGGDDRKATLYDRAGHFRRGNEYDKAAAIYETILNEDSTDAEAYWSIVLCKYGVEYVEDPITRRRVPTCNRTQLTSILADENYKQAIEHAEGLARSIYEEEARAIDAIQRGILEISNKEEPFDVFICYKELGENGQRTKESVLAQDIYQQLTKDGYKVFFSRITLEKKLGQQYEPYIFAALNSAKVMLVVGTKPEHFGSVWVKNEWSRYLALAKDGGGKLLIPCYRDMDVYDLPDELSMLQSQDMGKIGFLQDLMHGVKKVLDAGKPSAGATPSAASGAASGVTGSGGANTYSSPTVDALLRRALIFLEDGDWKQANEYCERVLDAEPENAIAYVVKLCAELHFSREALLAECDEPLSDMPNFQKALRFADDTLIIRLNGYAETVAKRFREAQTAAAEEKERRRQEEEKQRQAAEARRIDEEKKRRQEETRKNDEIYDKAAALFDEKSYNKAGREFEKIPGHRDAQKRAEKCFRLEKEAQEAADEAKANDAYESALKQSKTAKSAAELSAVAAAFGKLGKRRDAAEQADKFEKLAAAKKKKQALMIAISGAAAAVVIAAVLIIILAVIPANKYSAAEKTLAEGKYPEAIEAFKALGNYKDARDRLDNVMTDYYGITFFNGGTETKFGSLDWLVLKLEDGKALLLTKDIFSRQDYDSGDPASVTWETCALRSSLNDSFYGGRYFSDDERARILLTPLSNSTGNDTLDHVFLLSVEEAREYFPNDQAMAATYNGDGRAWWLRSPGEGGEGTAFVTVPGGINIGYLSNSLSKGTLGGGVRPAIWIELAN